MRALAWLLPLLLAVPAQAFLFGGASDARARALLEEMRAARDSGDCSSVGRLSESFFAEKPPASLREEVYACVGACYERGGLTDKAISSYKLALELYPGNTLFAGRLAGIYNAAGFHANAVPLFLRVLERRPDDVPACLGLARAYAALGFHARAKTYYSRAVVLQDFSDSALLKEYAAAMLRKRDWDEALFIAGKGAALLPGDAAWTLTRARAYYGRGDHHKALPELEAALLLAPSRALRLERALCLLMAGLPRRAMAAAEPELAADPADPLAALVKGMALYNLGEKAAAAPYFKTAGAGGPFTAAVAAAFAGGAAPTGTETCKN